MITDIYTLLYYSYMLKSTLTYALDTGHMTTLRIVQIIE